MSERLAKKIIDFQCKFGVIDEKKRRLYEYAYDLLISRTMVYVMIIAVGIFWGNIKEMFIFLVAFIALRQYAGGLHLENSGRCIFISGILVGTVGQYIKYYPMITAIVCIVWVAATGIIFVLAPVGCRNKKLDLTEQEVYRKRSRILLAIECVLAGCILGAGSTWISKGIILAQVVLSISLVIGWIKENFFCPRVS